MPNSLTLSDFPDDIVIDILSWLPVKSLLCFRCVSKALCALIDSPNFVKLNLTRNKRFLIFRDSTTSLTVDLYSPDVAVEQIAHHPLNRKEPVISGSCDGLVLSHYHIYRITLCNPSTRKFHLLPLSEIEFRYDIDVVLYTQYGLGYDFVTNDYKVVTISQFSSSTTGTFNSQVKVYSLKSDSWRSVQDLPYFLRQNNRVYGVLVGGALHWVVSRMHRKVDHVRLIAAFDLGTEEYRLVPLPEFGNDKFCMGIGVLEGSLFVLCNYLGHRVDVWVMKDYGVKESWTKLFSIAQPKDIEAFKYVRPLAHTKYFGEIILVQDNMKLIMFDLGRKCVNEIEVRVLPSYFEQRVFVQSLVPLPINDQYTSENASKDDAVSDSGSLTV